MNAGETDLRNHINRKGRAWNPRTEFSAGEIRFLKAFDKAGSGVAIKVVGELMGINRRTAYQYRDNLIAMGALGSEGEGRSRTCWLTAAGKLAARRE